VTSLTEKLARAKLAVFDVDGVLTDGGLYYGPEGEMMKRFDVKDGHALVLARLVHFKVAILTARTSRIVQKRAEELQIPFVKQGAREKGLALVSLCAEAEVSVEETVYMGDDVNDLPAMRQCLASAAPSDACLDVLHHVDFVSRHAAGHGAAREWIEMILKASGHWAQALALMR
jgi:3-deoxy-D-manno-octulosonate 8-phosphate phosphatase (KDO 8-P phosphatase)